MKVFNIIAPMFHGFYNTIWEPDTEQEESELLHGQTLEFDNKEYMNSIGEAFCEAIKEFLPELIGEIKFIKINSPREYNFTNDKIECEVSLSKTNLDSLKQLIYDNKEKFEVFLKHNYKSYSGFTSFYSTEFNEWKDKTNDFSEFEDDTNYLTGCLDFALQLDEIDQQQFHDEVHTYDNCREYQFSGIIEDETKYSRQCVVTGHGMSEGFVVGNGDTICNDEEILCKWLRENIYQDDKEALKLSDEFLIKESYGGPIEDREDDDPDGDEAEGFHYYTEWENPEVENFDEGYYYTARGEKIFFDGREPADKSELQIAMDNLTKAINNNGVSAWDGHLQETADAVMLDETEMVIDTDEEAVQFTGISKYVDALQKIIDNQSK